jgi:hypothetical protein
VCEACRDVYNVYIRWDNALKVVKIYTQTMGSPVGAFATRELNLKEINYKGKSTNFATRLYAYGKDGLSFASINGGRPYVDDNTYSNRVICAYWSDDRYTDNQSLLEDARKHLAKLAVPERSYDCAIVDLQATNPDLYNNLDFSLFTAATLIDDVKGTSVDYQVIERHVWPHHPDRNDVIFNSAPIKLQNTVIQIQDELTDPDSTFQQILKSEIAMTTDWLLNRDSHLYLERNADGSIKAFIFVCGDEPIATATRVMRIDASGIGFSKTGANGPFVAGFAFDFVNDLGAHLNADFITVGTMVANRIRGGLLESSDNPSDPNFSLNMNTGALIAKLLSITTPHFTLNNNGDMTAEDCVLTSVTINGITGADMMLAGAGVEFFRTGTDTMIGSLGVLAVGIIRELILRATNNLDLWADNNGTISIYTGGTVSIDGNRIDLDGTVYTNNNLTFNGVIKDENGGRHQVVNGLILNAEPITLAEG